METLARKTSAEWAITRNAEHYTMLLKSYMKRPGYRKLTMVESCLVTDMLESLIGDEYDGSEPEALTALEALATTGNADTVEGDALTVQLASMLVEFMAAADAADERREADREKVRDLIRASEFAAGYRGN